MMRLTVSSKTSTTTSNNLNKLKKRPRSGNAGWTPVADVGLPDEGNNKNHYDGHGDDDDDDEVNHGHRHPRRRGGANAAQDLEAEPRESVGICFGLEVLSGSQYHIDAEGKFQVIEEPLAQVGTTSTSSTSRATKAETPPTDNNNINHDTTTPAPTKKTAKQKKRAKKKKKKQQAIQDATTPQERSEDTAVKDEQVEAAAAAVLQVQQQWLQATGVWLEDVLCQRLVVLNYVHPTPIQIATLAASAFQNVVGAAPTGSGKTLAFLLPIVRHCWAMEKMNSDTAIPLQALILTPTRELALQIHQEAVLILNEKKRVGCLTGGLAVAKQARVLQQRPWILVATPGRLWELVRNLQYLCCSFVGSN